jgi:septal ring factor EnvC (AmiA/AmiB activator)
VSLERAADDLTRIRGQEAEAAESFQNEVTRFETDLARAEQQQTQPQAQPEFAPQPETTEIPGIDPEIVDAIQRSPKLLQTLQEEGQRVRAVEQRAAQAEQQAAALIAQAQQVALHFTIGNFPELAGLTQEQVPAALRVLAQANPARFQQVVSQLAKLDQVAKTSQHIQAQQQQQQAAQVEQWSRLQDSQMDAYLAKSERPETVKAVKENVGRIAHQVYGIEPTALAQALQSTPALRSFEFQRLLYDATKYHLAQEGVTNKQYTALPPVQKPGVAQAPASRDHAAVAEAKARFLKNPNDPKLAAAFITAKRNAR